MTGSESFKNSFYGVLIAFSLAVWFYIGVLFYQAPAINFNCSQSLTLYDTSLAKDHGFDRSLIDRAIETIHNKSIKHKLNETCKKRLPTSIVIGVRKCGTKELLQFLHLHPHVEVFHQKSFEMSYFIDDELFNRGEVWFRKQMPCTYSSQITVMKNSLYFSTPYTAKRIYEFNSNTKLLLMVREPVSRVISQYMFSLQRKQIPSGKSLEHIIFENNRLNEDHHIIKHSVYYTSMLEYLKYFTIDQILIIDSDELKYNPVKVLQKVEDFLGLPHFIKSNMFVWNKDKGYYCIKTDLSDTGMACYPPGRGKHIVDINPQTKAILTDYFKPWNQRFYGIIGRSFKWN